MTDTAGDHLSELVTVVLLTYNCARRIVSIHERLQDLRVPIVVVDNASEDGTADLLERRGAQVCRMDRNIGAAARNVGAQAARTPYVAFCDDDGWFERDGLERAVAMFAAHPALALVNARIVVGPEETLDPICVEMAASPLPDHHQIPGHVLLGFMAGAVVMRRSAFLSVGGYDERFFIGGEEETLAVKLARRGWQLRYVPEVGAKHLPSVANAPYLRAYAMRNTLWNCWLHRRLVSALRWTAFVLADVPKNSDWLHGVAMFLSGLPRIIRERDPMSPELDRAFAALDRRRFAERRPIANRHDPLRELRTDRKHRTSVGPREGLSSR